MKSFFTAAFLSLSISLFAHAEDAPAAIQKQCNTLLDATKENNIEKFESVCDKDMKEAITPEILTMVSGRISAAMKKGYIATFMGSLNRLEATTYCWKLDYTDEKTPDSLVQMTTVENEVAGFLIQ